MVDFQSRDTRRSRSGSEDEPDGDAAEESAGEPDGTNVGESGVTDASPDGAREGISAAVVTVADGRSHEEDPAGDAVVEVFQSAGHGVATREVIRSGHDTVQQTVDTLAGRSDVDTVVTVGGTGVGSADITVEAVSPLYEKELPGFGELFRHRYAESVGADVLGTRAIGGMVDGTPVFSLPADPEGARLGVGELVVDQAGRLAAQARAEGPADR